MTETIRVFISYSHDNEEHRERVLSLSDQLNDDGIECFIDKYVTSPPEGWPVWMVKQIKHSDFVLIVCTEKYMNRFEQEDEKEDEGFGVAFEGAIITQSIYNQHSKNYQFIPIVFDEDNIKFIPLLLNGSSFYNVSNKPGYEDLLRHLTDQPATPKPETKQIKVLPPKERKPLFENTPQSLTVNLPQRNPFFTGRKDILTNLHKSFKDSNSLAITQAIKGLGGVGKSETAIEYAYRNRNDYNAVFWVRSETPGELLKDFALIGAKLGVASGSDMEIFLKVKSWLEQNDNWLLVLDNVEDLTSIQQIIPSPCPGSVLITTRSNATGRFKDYSLDCMNDADGALLLLRRSKIIAEQDNLQDADDDQQNLAKTISHTLGGLPLALDQAGAYIEENTYGLDDYLEEYQENKDLLDQRGELSQATHPDSVAVTFSLCFNKLQKKSPESAQLLEMCAFLAPDDIPEEIFTDGLQQDKKSLLKCIAAATRLSLLDRDPKNKTFSIHRLVQEVLRQGMDKDKQKATAEYCVRALNKVYPDPEFENWPQCSRLTPHAQSLFKWIVEYSLESNQAAHLLNQTAYYLDDQARYAEAEPLYLRAIEIGEKTLGPEHPHLTTYLNNLAELYRDQGKYEQAEPLYLRAIEIDEKALGKDHPGLAIDLNNLALLYYSQGKYEQAEPLYKQAIEIDKKALDDDHPQLATHLNNLAGLYRAQGKYEQAEPLYLRAIEIGEKTLGPEHPNLAIRLNNLAGLYRAQGKYEQAEPLYLRAIEIDKKALDDDHPQLATQLNNLANLYLAQGKYEQAEPLYLRAIAIDEKALGKDHPGLATDLNNLAGLYRAQGKYEQAEPLYLRAIEIDEKALPDDHPDLAMDYENYAIFLQETGREDEAREYEAKAQAIHQKRGD